MGDALGYLTVDEDFPSESNQLRREVLWIVEKLAADCHHISAEHGFYDESEEKQIATKLLDILLPASDSGMVGGQGMLSADVIKLCRLIRTQPTRNFGEQVALMHSELSELLEADRSGKGFKVPSAKIPSFTEEEEEAADLLIRLLDTAHFRNWRLGEATLAKMAYNRNRPHKHGKKY